MRAILILTSVALLASCAQFPEVDAVTSQDISAVAYPKLVPASQIAHPGPGYLTTNSASNLEGRVSGLRRRADDLRNRPIE